MTIDRKQPWVTTPLIRSPHLSKTAGCRLTLVPYGLLKTRLLNRRSRVLLKLDNLQPSGSFKSRGIGNYLLHRIRENEALGRIPHFYASSGGNAGIACVVAARSLGYHASVVVPTTTSPALIARLHAEGVTEVIQHGLSVMDADKYLKAVVLPADPEGVYVPPFDHPDIWEGNSTVMHEIAAQLNGEKPDAVVCSVGGGGLMNGIVQSLDSLGWSDDVTVVAMETDGADSLARALKANRVITMDKITSQARSLGVATVSERTFELAQRKQVINAVLPDGEAAKGCLTLARHERMMVELTAGIAIRLCEDRLLDKIMDRKLGPDATVVLCVCGGNDISVEKLMEWQEQYCN